MSYWDSRAQKTVHVADSEWPGYPNWVKRDCYCCAGLRWGGAYPQECDYCGGNGFYGVHKPTGTVALYPGGPLRGARETVP